MKGVRGGVVVGALAAAGVTTAGSSLAAAATTGAGASALQAAGPPQTAWQMISQATLPTLLVLVILAIFSFLSWVLIFWKWRQFQSVRRQGDRFLDQMDRAQDLGEAYRAIITLPESPYGRVFRQGVNFFTELRPGALKEDRIADGADLSSTQLAALRMVLEKEEAEERDELAHGLSWLAIIGSISPLLGLMGTVIGIMNTFLGITQAGSTSIGAVAPGIAEALTTTVVGLAVAIPAVIGYNHFVSRLNLFSGELEGFSSEFIGTLAREGRF